MTTTPTRVGKRARSLPPPTYTDRERELMRKLRLVQELVAFPFVVAALLFNRRIDPAYGLTWPKRFRLGWRMYRNSFKVFAATSWKAHLAMAAKILEVPADVPGAVVECGCFIGGSTANLSLVCDLVGRDLIVYDSFEGMPPPKPGDKYAEPKHLGAFKGELEQVRENVRRHGVIERCTFRKGWFADTLPHHTGPIVLMFLDVDHQASLHDCLVNLWPHLDRQGYVFIDEYSRVDYCAVFFSERYWRTYFDTTPPGLLGVGTGVPLGQVMLGPYPFHPPLQTASSIAWTRKDMPGAWTYFPDDGPAPGAGATG